MKPISSILGVIPNPTTPTSNHSNQSNHSNSENLIHNNPSFPKHHHHHQQQQQLKQSSIHSSLNSNSNSHSPIHYSYLPDLAFNSDHSLSSLLLDLDRHFQAFRSALLQDPRPNVISQSKDDLVCLLDHALNLVVQSQAASNHFPILSMNTPSLVYHQPQSNSYFPRQPDSPSKKPCFPLKLERKRSRERPDGHRHNPKAARSDGSLHSSAGILSRRTSQIGAISPLTSATTTLTDFDINGLLSPTSNSNPSAPLPTPTVYTHSHQSSSSCNPLKHQFTPISHPAQFHPTCKHPPPPHLAQKPPGESPNTHHCPSTSYSTLSNTPLVSPHDLCINSNTSENPLLAIINDQLNRHPDMNLSQNQPKERFLDTTGEPQLPTEKPNSLRVQLSDLVSESTYQQPSESKPISTSALESTLDSLGAPPIAPPAPIEPNHREPGFPCSEPIDDPTSDRVDIESEKHSRRSHALSPSHVVSSGNMTHLLTLPAPLCNQSASTLPTLQQDPNDKIMVDAQMTDDPLVQSTPLPTADQSSTVGLIYRSSQNDIKPKIRSRAGTIESLQQPPSHPLFSANDEAPPKNEGGNNFNHISNQSFHPSAAPLQFQPPCSTIAAAACNIPPSSSEASLMGSSASLPTYPQEPSHHENHHPPPRIPSPPVNKQMGAASAGVSDELAAQFEPIFNNWLGRLCSDLDMKDSKGEPIHQTLMARKMQRLEESADFRPFKFRIQAFTNSFFEELVRHGFKEKDLPMKKVRQYLWSQSCISRFNEEGKKAKSKGNHVWHIEAQKILNGQWNFLHFQSKIIANPPTQAFVGVKWSWFAKVWDPQCSAQNIKAVFSSPELPPWLRWKGNVLSGIPGPEVMGMEYEIVVIATTNPHPKKSSLDLTFRLSVKSREEMNTTRENDKKARESQPDSNIPPSSSEPRSFDNTPNHSPDLSGVANQNSYQEAIPNGTLGLEGNWPAPPSQLPGLSRTNSGESVSISSASLDDLHRSNVMVNFGAVLQDKDAEFDSTSAASVLNGMSTATIESVVDALGKFTDVQVSIDAKPQTIELPSHPLGSIHVVPQAGLRSTLDRGTIAAEDQMNSLSDLGVMMPSNPPLEATLVVEHVSCMIAHSSNLGHVDSGTSDGAAMLEQIMGSSSLMHPEPTSINPPAAAMEIGHAGHPNPSSDLNTRPNCVHPSTCADLSTTTDETLNDTTVQMEEAAVAAQQQAVALHEARLQTVRENLMSPDVEISDSAGNLMRKAIISDDPLARQFAADVLAPLTSSTCSNPAPVATITTTTTANNTSVSDDTPPTSRFVNATNRPWQ